MPSSIPAWIGLAGGLLGSRSTSLSNRPTSGTQTSTRDPWGPTQGALLDILGLGREVYEHQAGFEPPPQFRPGGGAGRSALRDLMEEAQRRSSDTSFVDRAQELALERASGPTDFMRRAFEGAENYRTPEFDIGTNSALSELLANLSGGQTRLGVSGPGPPAVPTMISRLAGDHFSGGFPSRGGPKGPPSGIPTSAQLPQSGPPPGMPTSAQLPQGGPQGMTMLAQLLQSYNPKGGPPPGMPTLAQPPNKPAFS